MKYLLTATVSTMHFSFLLRCPTSFFLSRYIPTQPALDWTAVMFFKHQNGTYKRVPIMQNTALPNGINGGMTVYYTQKDFNSNGNNKITSFKPVCVSLVCI